MKLNEALSNTKNTFQKIENQKKVAVDILYMLAKNNHPEAVVAGGAPRNWEFGKPANDIDIYLCRPLLETELSNLIGVDSYKTLGKKYDGYGLKEISRVLETSFGGTKVQFISIDRKYKNSKNFAHHVFRTFDFGICKIGWTPEGFIKSKEFEYDKENKTLTINMSNILEFSDPMSLPKRVKKMKKYFPNFSVDIV